MSGVNMSRGQMSGSRRKAVPITDRQVIEMKILPDVVVA